MKDKYFHYDILEVYDLSKLEEQKNHRRLQVFCNKGCKCVECGIEGTIVALGKDKGGNLHLDVYTSDFYPLTVDHIIPKSKGGSDDITNLQPMCCLCNWNKGNGDRPANIGRRKYKYEDDIPIINILPKFKNEEFSKTGFKIGDAIYRRTGTNKKKYKEIGIISKFCINPHTGLEAVMLEGNSKSFYHINQIYKKL